MKVLPKSFLEWRTAPRTIFIIALLIAVGGFAIIFQNEITYRSVRDRQAAVAAEATASSRSSAANSRSISAIPQPRRKRSTRSR